MAKCHSLGVGYRRFPSISAASLRRRLIAAVSFGCTAPLHRRKHRARPPKPMSERNLGSDRLSELLKIDISDLDSDPGTSSDDSDSESETRRKIEAFEELQGAVKGLQRECGERRRAAAATVRRLAKGDAEARKTLAMLGAIPPLIGMIESDDLEAQISALYALLNLGIGNDMNKAAIVKAGAVHRMLSLLKSRTHPSISEAIVANFLSLSALDSNKPIIGTSGAIPFLIKTFQYPTSLQSQQDSLRAIYNLSISLTNIPHLIESGLVPCLLSSIGDMDSTDRVLAIFSNLVSTFEGRRAVTRANDGVSVLIDVLNWIDSPTCQEKAAYVLMVIAHKSEADRALMMNLGIKSALLELALVGSSIAQKRACSILEILRADKGKQVSEGFLGPPEMSSLVIGEEAEVGVSEERRAVKELVNESLQSNLKRIAKRANLIRDFQPSDRYYNKGTSKSLPF